MDNSERSSASKNIDNFNTNTDLEILEYQEVKDMVMILRRCVRRLNSSEKPADLELADQILSFLVRHGLIGTCLRENGGI